MSILDLIILALYFTIILWIAKWASSKGNDSNFSSVEYFLAGKSQSWLLVGTSLFASNIGSEIILGVSGAGARAEMPMANFEMLASLILILLGWFFVPFYLRTGVFTMPEFLEKRYSKASRNYLSVVSLLAYIVTKISLIIFAGALVFEVLGIPFWTGAIITVVATGFYTVLGGLKSVIYTDMIQAFFLLFGTLGITLFGLYQIGGWGELMSILENAGQNASNPQPSEFFNLWRPHADSQYPWTGMLFGAPILGIWYWCTDQYIVQRVLSAKNIDHARKGALLAGYLKLLPVFIFFLPGVIAYALMQEGLINFSMSNADQALPTLITEFLPGGLRGLAIAGLLAALMSSLSSAFNSSSTLLTIDFYQKFRPEATESELVKFGRLATGLLVIVSLGWIPFMEKLMGGGIFLYLQSVQAYISPPIAAVFVLGLTIKWVNSRAAIVTLWTGFIVGLTRLILEFTTKNGTIAASEGSFIHQFVNINFLHFAFLLFVFCSIILIAISKATSNTTTNDEQITFQSGAASYPKSDVWLTVFLIISVLGLWLIFSPFGIG